MSIFGAIKAVSPTTSVDPKKFQTMKSAHDIRHATTSSLIVTKEDEDAKRGKDVETAADVLKVIIRFVDKVVNAVYV